MRHEALFDSMAEKSRWLELEVTIGTNDTLIEQDLSKLRSFLKKFNEIEMTNLQRIVGISINVDAPLQLESNLSLLKLLLIKKFVDRHGLSVIREAKSNPGLSEVAIFTELADALFSRNEFPENIYVYAVYRQRGTPTTWLKIINNLTPDQVEQKLEGKIKALQSYITYHLKVARRYRFTQRIGNLTIFILSKPISAKVIKGELKNLEAQRATYTMIILDKNQLKIGVVTGSKREIQLIQKYLRYKLFPDSIGTPRSESNSNKKELLKKILVSNPSKNILLDNVAFKRTALPDSPSLKLKASEGNTLDGTLNALSHIVNELGIDDLKSLDFQYNGRNINVYLYGDEWKRVYINVAAKGKSIAIENIILEELNERLGKNIKETSFIVENLTNEEILRKIFRDKKVTTLPPVPKQVERIIIDLINEKIIKKPTKISKRKCLNCHSYSWNEWECPKCDRDTMIIVGEEIHINLLEKNFIDRVSKVLEIELHNAQVTLIPYKQRRNYKKSVIRIYNRKKNLSVFTVLISHENDLPFVEDLLNEGFGIVAIVAPEMSEKADYLRGIGCELVDLSIVVNKIIYGNDSFTFSIPIENQERKVLERVFANLRISLNRLNNKPTTYQEDLFEVDITNLFQAITPDVIRLGTEYKGKSVPDGYCSYGYRTAVRRKIKRLFGWDAKYSFSSNYKLGSGDLIKQKRYVEWLSTKGNEPSKIGSLGIYAFVSNFESADGFTTVLNNLVTWSGFPKGSKLVLIEDKFLLKICEWLLDHWQVVIDNNSVISEEVFKFLRRNKRGKQFNIFTQSDWPKLKEILDKITQMSL